MPKKRTKNTEYKIQIRPKAENKPQWEKYIFKDKGYLSLHWRTQGERNWCFHGFITPEKLKEKLTTKQYRKFCEGKTNQFIIQKH